MHDAGDFSLLSDCEAAEVVGGGPLGLGLFMYLLNNFDSFLDGARAGYAAASPKL